MRCNCLLCSSPFQYAPAMESSLNALIFAVLGTCGPRQKSMKCGPSVYSLNTSPARSEISSHFIRSEEHTSELQSPCNLVCRLLLEKKTKKYKYIFLYKKKKYIIYNI